jgi:acid phosphatase class B
MRIKIGDKIYNGQDEPIMVIFDDNDKKTLLEALNNSEWQGKYAMCPHPKEYFKNQEEKIKWMDNIGEEAYRYEPLNLIGVEL